MKRKPIKATEEKRCCDDEVKTLPHPGTLEDEWEDNESEWS